MPKSQLQITPVAAAVAAALAISSFVLLNAAEAKITITRVAGASVFDTGVGTGSGATTTSPVIYGGSAGISNSQATPNGDGTINTCAHAPKNFACNEHAITTSSDLTIYLQSDAKSGYPVAYVTPATSGSTATVISTGSIPTSGINQEIAVTIPWSNICQNMSATNGGTITSCTISGAGSKGQISLTVGLSAAGSGTIPTTTDDTPVSINVVLATDIGQVAGGTTTSTVTACENEPLGLCAWQVGAGDSKVVLRDPAGKQGFPTYSPLVINKVRLLWAEGSGAYDSILPDSPHSDLDLTVANDQSITLAPTRVEGFSNDKTYSFIVASIDTAGNIGYYTDSTAYDYCPFATTTKCHEATPGEVVGVLSQNVNCYVATAAFGSTMAPQVKTFREFRNRYLLTNAWGKRFVRFYYKHSPKYAKIIAESETLRALARASLWPFLIIAWLAVHLGGWATFALSTGALLMTLIAISHARRKRGVRA